MSGARSYHAGLAAEDIVARHYVNAGAQVLQMRWRGQAGEIDLIVQQGETYVFVEVKTSKSHACAAARVSPRQAQRIMTAATEFVGTKPQGQLAEMRFDVATVDAQGTVHVLENAFVGF